MATISTAKFTMAASPTSLKTPEACVADFCLIPVRQLSRANIARAEEVAKVLIHGGLDRNTDSIRFGANRRRAALDAEEWVELLDALGWDHCW